MADGLLINEGQSGGSGVRAKGYITFLLQELLHKRSCLFFDTRNHTVIYFLGKIVVESVHELLSPGEDTMNACSHSDSMASLSDATSLLFSRTAH